MGLAFFVFNEPWLPGLMVAGWAVWILGTEAAPREFLLYPGVDHGRGVIAVFLIALLVNGFGEETGWRGFLQHHLAGTLGNVRATLVVAGLWLLWHLPIFFIHAGFREMVGPALVGWVLGLTLASFVLGWMYVVFGRSILMVALWHTIYNYTAATPPTTGTIAAVVTTFVMLGGLAILGRWTWQARRS